MFTFTRTRVVLVTIVMLVSLVSFANLRLQYRLISADDDGDDVDDDAARTAGDATTTDGIPRAIDVRRIHKLKKRLGQLEHMFQTLHSKLDTLQLQQRDDRNRSSAMRGKQKRKRKHDDSPRDLDDGNLMHEDTDGDVAEHHHGHEKIIDSMSDDDDDDDDDGGGDDGDENDADADGTHQHHSRDHADPHYTVVQHKGKDGKIHDHHILKFPDDLDSEVTARKRPANIKKPASFSSVSDECSWMGKTFNVHPGQSWGNLALEDQDRWSELKCDAKFSRTQAPAKPLDPPEPAAKPERLPGTEHLYKDKNPMIAIIVPTTTRKIHVRSFSQLSVFRDCLPSIGKTVVPGFDYGVFVAYDHGDGFFDDQHRHTEIREWFRRHVSEPAKARGADVVLHLHGFANPLKKPIPVFNAALNKAYEEGADFFLRINDDTKLLTPWANQYVKVLGQWGPPYGATGPFCQDGNASILTHDFVHRTHMDIFAPYYYPQEFTDWYIDDWITRVYGRKRTRRIKAVVVRHSQGHGTRYSVDYGLQKALPKIVRAGGEKILAWMKDPKNKMTKDHISEFVSDTFKYNVILDDRRRRRLRSV